MEVQKQEPIYQMQKEQEIQTKQLQTTQEKNFTYQFQNQQ